MSLKELISNPSGRLSTSDTITFFTFLFFFRCINLNQIFCFNKIFPLFCSPTRETKINS